MTTPQQSRRDFVKASAVATVGIPTIVSSAALAQPAPSDKVIVGLVGCGDLGRRHHLAGNLLRRKEFGVGAVCDVDRVHMDDAVRLTYEATGKRPFAAKDFRHVCERKDLDAIMCVTTDHWHTLVSLYAMQCGKDVYCQKPLTMTVEEGKRIVETAKQYGTVFQTGSQQRSDRRFRLAAELARNEKIGKLKTVDTIIGGVGDGTWQDPMTPPAELDWDFWLGPAPYSEYTPDRCYYNFRWYSDYSGGKMTDWGAHHNDIAQWGIGADGSGPVEVRALEAVYSDTGPYDVMKKFHVQYTYANGVVLNCHSDAITRPDGVLEGNGVLFTGTNGWVFVNRSKIEASDPDLLKTEFGPNDVRLYVSNDHHQNWVDCIRERKGPICDAEVGHRSVTVCHLGNIAGQLGRPLQWDPEAEQFVDDEQANRLISKPMRAPWSL